MNRGIVLGITLTVGLIACASTRPPAPAQPMLPPQVDVEPLLPPAPARPRLGPRPFDDTPVYERLPGLPGPGVLLSDVSYAEAILDRSELDRLRIEAGALRRLRGEERTIAIEVEAAYLRKVEDLERAVVVERRWGLAKLWGGVAAGAVVVLLGAWAVGQVSR